jgi:subtilisin-like proprotein convertase family protein
MSLRNLLFFTILFSSFYATSQVGINNTSPATTLDVRGKNNNGAVTALDGVLVPRVNDLIIAGSTNSQLVYLIADSGNNKKGFYYWNVTRWYPLQVTAGPMITSTIVLPDVSFIGTSSNSYTNNVGSVINNPTSPYTKNFVVSGISGTTTLVTFTLNITHETDSDLDIFLLAPTGQILELSTDNGGNGNDYTNTVFSDAGATNITAGAAPFTGTFRPEGTLTASGAPLNLTATITTFAGFNGLNPNGTWSLRFGDDNNNGETGNYISGTLNITSATAAPNWVLMGEVSIPYLTETSIIVQTTYSGDTTDLNGVITALTRSTATAGAAGTTIASLPGTIINYASASPSGAGNFWVNTVNQARNSGLIDNTLYYYQLWRKGNIESPVASNETFSIVPFRVKL